MLPVAEPQPLQPTTVQEVPSSPSYPAPGNKNILTSHPVTPESSPSPLLQPEIGIRTMHTMEAEMPSFESEFGSEFQMAYHSHQYGKHNYDHSYAKLASIVDLLSSAQLLHLLINIAAGIVSLPVKIPISNQPCWKFSFPMTVCLEQPLSIQPVKQGFHH